jgi:hypothetical protein
LVETPSLSLRLSVSRSTSCSMTCSTSCSIYCSMLNLESVICSRPSHAASAIS